MNILMMTNTYLPHVGGVARSVESCAVRLRRLGHQVLVMAPTFPHMPEHEEGVLRVPAIQRYNGSDFSVRLPIFGLISPALDEFRPQIVHAHHPFLLGDTALRIATLRSLPLLFTHHTMYERYTHYVPGDSPALRLFAMSMATEYANLCDHVIAPSESVADVLRERGVSSDITVIPTGIETAAFAAGDGAAARRRHEIDAGAFVVGHVGRLAPEKNLAFLARAVAAFLENEPRGVCLIAGEGPSRREIVATFEERGLRDRLRLAGVLRGAELAGAYRAMDVFAFASHTETQGMVLAEAMAAAVPVVALDAPGAREVVRDGTNGRLLPREDEADFAAALGQVAALEPARREEMRAAARRTAGEFSLERCTARLESLYRRLIGRSRQALDVQDNAWTRVLRQLEMEWNLWSSRAGAAIESIMERG